MRFCYYDGWWVVRGERESGGSVLLFNAAEWAVRDAGKPPDGSALSSKRIPCMHRSGARVASPSGGGSHSFCGSSQRGRGTQWLAENRESM